MGKTVTGSDFQTFLKTWHPYWPPNPPVHDAGLRHPQPPVTWPRRPAVPGRRKARVDGRRQAASDHNNSAYQQRLVDWALRLLETVDTFLPQFSMWPSYGWCRVCRQTKYELPMWYSLAQDHSDTICPEENEEFSKTDKLEKFEKFENAWGGKKKCKNHIKWVPKICKMIRRFQIWPQNSNRVTF